jgi:hypothetical protein
MGARRWKETGNGLFVEPAWLVETFEAPEPRFAPPPGLNTDRTTHLSADETIASLTIVYFLFTMIHLK